MQVMRLDTPFGLQVNSKQIKNFKELALKLIVYELVPLVDCQLLSSVHVNHYVMRTVVMVGDYFYVGNSFERVVFRTLIVQII